MTKLIRTLCFSVLLTSSGCGTMVSHVGECGSRPHGVYMGTGFDAACIAAPFSSEPYVELLPVGLIDLPLSVAADTIIFPFDLVDNMDRKKSEKEMPLQPNQQSGANGRQPVGSDKNRASAAAASRPSP